MKKKYITTQILLACGSRRPRKDIYEQLVETLAEREKVIAGFEKLFRDMDATEILLSEKHAA